MGKRQFRYQLLNPTFDDVWLDKEYSLIDHILSKDPTIIQLIRNKLQSVRDIEKINRQLITGKVNPSTLYNLFKTIEIINEINNEYIKDDGVISNSNIELQALEILGFMKTNFDIEKCQGVNSMSQLNTNIINTNVCDELDGLVMKQISYNNEIEV